MSTAKLVASATLRSHIKSPRTSLFKLNTSSPPIKGCKKRFIETCIFTFRSSGVLVTQVAPLGAFAKAGIKEDDVVLEIDGKKVRDFSLTPCFEGEKIKLKLELPFNHCCRLQTMVR